MHRTDAPEAPEAPSAPSSKHTRRRFLLGGAAVLGLAATGTSAWALNRFVVDHTEISDVAAYEAANSSVQAATQAAATSVEVTDSSYSSSNTSITIDQVTTGSGSDTVTYYVADVTVADATTIRSAFANNEYGTNITAKPTQIASEHDAILAINGDYYGFRSDGILIRNGVVYRDAGVREGIAFYLDGHAEVYDETSTDAQTLLDSGVWNTCSFGPALIKDGQVLSGIDSVEVDTNVGNHSIQGEQPRTAFGLIGDNHYAFVVVDGRNEGYSRGVTMTELAQIMAGLGCQVAYNLDGGGSSALYFNGAIINQPSNGGERATSDIFYIAKGS
ncbi:phosphodiester glycosidase family protein [Actinomyces slackii]|uniref:Exopolysaccharide biosynthesis protein related to N-acetylglucosamine-1-phosphodiester alpha-N-acetylglucosaminidase n=1 Tax=Actinomyces slackii TaxID=52774 RepID=A0A3S4SDL6_9ACTO|nr:phosphodiester glycosidase family protein [Actinomyces slackii]VEG73630.1 Exopolysaccharide biosynthesis protein related to N-acetylglucosamine-1-phosphodiester alpha-N-acetylglucosaminidase [Actinomyces slackii]